MNKQEQLSRTTQQYMTESMTPRPNISVVPTTTGREMEGRRQHRNACVIQLDRIAPDPNQPRKAFDESALNQLAHSLTTKGQLQPIRVRWSADLERYVIISGERRYRAAQRAKLPSLECVVHDKALTDDELFELALIENCVREDLNPIEEARAYRELMTKKSWKPQHLADELKIHRTTIGRALALLKLPEDIQTQVSGGTIPPGVAREIARADSEAAQREMVDTFLQGGLSSAEAAKQVSKPDKGKRKQSASMSVKKLSRSFPSGIKITITSKKKEANAVLASCLKEWAEAILADGRSQNTGKAA